jgi:predicted membrane protein
MRQRSNSIFWGVILILLGILWMFDNLGYIDFWDFVESYWPVILIIIGISIILKNRATKIYEQPEAEMHHSTTARGVKMNIESEKLNYSNIFGDVVLDITSQHFYGGSVSNVFGDIEIDLTKTHIESGEKILHINGVFGDIDIAVSKDLPVAVYGNITFGDIKILGEKRSGISQQLNYKSPNYDQSDKKIKIYISQVFGDIKVI